MRKGSPEKGSCRRRRLRGRAARSDLERRLPTRKRNELMLQNARELRKAMTKEERHLWYDFLRGYPVRFRRQEIIGSYIADFYCRDARLVIELDGSQHYEEDVVKYDDERTACLNACGIDVVRYSNLDIVQRFEGVCGDIDARVRKRPR